MIGLVVPVLLAVTAHVESFPSGAPASACNDIAPSQIFHGESRPLVNSPFVLSTTAFEIGNQSDLLWYSPGQNYTSELTVIMHAQIEHAVDSTVSIHSIEVIL